MAESEESSGTDTAGVSVKGREWSSSGLEASWMTPLGAINCPIPRSWGGEGGVEKDEAQRGEWLHSPLSSGFHPENMGRGQTQVPSPPTPVFTQETC